jgi:hypothetical protein
MSSEHGQAIWQALRTTRTLLFIGYGAGLTDPNFQKLFRWARSAFPDSEFRHYRLAPQGDVAQQRESHDPSDRIFVISYGDSHEDLPLFVEQLKAVPAHIDTDAPTYIPVEQAALETARNQEINKEPAADLAASTSLRNVSIHEGQFHCSVAIQAQPMRKSGISELLDDVILRFHGDPGTQRFVDLDFFFNVNVTSSLLLDPFTEATLSLASQQLVASMSTLHLPIHARTARQANALRFVRVPLHELTVLPDQDRILRLSNVRLNVNQLGSDRRVQISVSISDGTLVTSESTSVPTADHDLKVTVIHETGIAGQQAPKKFNRRESENAGLLADGKEEALVQFGVRFCGKIANYEQLPGRRTRLMLRFRGVPEGVAVFVTNQEVKAEPAGLRATLVETGPWGTGAWIVRPIEHAGNYEGKSVEIARVSLVLGSGIAVWEVESATSDISQMITVGVLVAYNGELEVGLPAAGSASMVANLAPLSVVTTISSSAPIPRFADVPARLEFFTIDP